MPVLRVGITSMCVKSIRYLSYITHDSVYFFSLVIASSTRLRNTASVFVYYDQER